jgi:hypothetical protein
MFCNADDVKSYILAGHATVTLTSQRTQCRYTFKVSQAKDRETGEPKDFWFVGLLAGPDNESDYQYMGLLDAQRGFRLTAKSRMTTEAKPVKGFDYMWRHVAAGQMPPAMEIRHEGACGRCGRKLTVPSSIDSGIGPECAKKMGGAA